MSEEIFKLAARGDGVTASGRYFPMTAPGDLVAEDGGVTPGPHRQKPPCRHYGTCGGCQLQHVDEATYAQFVSDRIADALAAQGIAAHIAPASLSPPHSRRRASLRAVRKGRQVQLGYAEAKSHTLVDLNECPVLDPALVALLKPLRTLFAKVLPDRKSANIVMTRVDQGVDLLIAGVEIEGLEALEALAEFGGRNGLARLSVDEGFGPLARYEPEPVTVTLGGTRVSFPEGAFLQATLHGETALVAAVLAALDGSTHRADLFAGLGSFTFASGAHYAAEGERDAALALQTACHARVSATSIEHRDLFRRPLSAAELSRFDGVVIDPPRAGAKEQIAQLAASKVRLIAAVSCNPATFARDARTLLDGGYTLDWVKPVGQFLWSTHVELVGAFRRN